MKKLLLIGILLISVTFSACIEVRCVVCDIYDEDGYFIKDYGEFCGSNYQREEYKDDADYHAYKYYGGWAECYYN